MDFTKKGAVKAQKELVSKLPRNRRKLNISVFKIILVLVLAIVIVGVGAGLEPSRVFWMIRRTSTLTLSYLRDTRQLLYTRMERRSRHLPIPTPTESMCITTLFLRIL